VAAPTRHEVTMDEREWLTERFEEHRSHLHAVAYRMLGSGADAEDALQEAWLRVRDHDPDTVENMRAWLTTVVGRVCLNMLRSRRTRLERLSEVHVPDPVVAFGDGTDPNEEALLADSVGLALLVVLDAMAPAERIAFVLHDVFGVSHADVATVLDRSETAAQQLASRARRRVRDSPEPDRDLARQRRVIDAFFAASRDGDFDGLIRVLHPDVVLTIDGGSVGRGASLTLRGAEAVAAHTRTYATLHPFVFPALVNGHAGAVIAPGGRPYAVMAFMSSSEGRILRIDALLDPERLAHLELTTPPIEEGPQ
jgi:RNA polymerase sigma-70 factor (ECF subfamily)